MFLNLPELFVSHVGWDHPKKAHINTSPIYYSLSCWVLSHSPISRMGKKIVPFFHLIMWEFKNLGVSPWAYDKEGEECAFDSVLCGGHLWFIVVLGGGGGGGGGGPRGGGGELPFQSLDLF
ncbi:hypothetical protein Dimus_032016 [Dionaea muscipula]